MEGGFVILSDRQMEWMKRAVGQMIELTAYYGTLERPLAEEDYDYILEIFSVCTKKYRNNAMIIQCSGVLAEYLDGLERGQTRLTRNDMAQVKQFVQEQFSCLKKRQECVAGADSFKTVQEEMEIHRGRYGKEKLISGLAEVFQNYLLFCAQKYEERGARGDDKKTGGKRETPVIPERKHEKSR